MKKKFVNKLSTISQINDNDLSGIEMNNEDYEELNINNQNVFIKK